MIDKSTYFYSDEESLDPTCAFVGLIVQLVEQKVWHPFISGCKKNVYCFSEIHYEV